MNKCLLALSLLWGTCARGEVNLEPEVDGLQVSTPERVLFVGNSYFYYNDSLHNHVRRLLAELAPEIDTRYKSATIGGARLAHHNVPHLLKPGQLGIEAPFQLVVLQGGSAETLSADRRQQFHRDVDRINVQVRGEGAELAFYMTHAYVAPHPGTDKRNFPLIYQGYVSAGNRVGALVIPVSLAFERALSQQPELGLHEFFDGTHPNVQGSYLAACVVVASVYGINPVGAAYDAYAEIEAAEAKFLQSIAWQTIDDFYDR